MWREDREQFEKIGRELAQKTLSHANAFPPMVPSNARAAGDRRGRQPEASAAPPAQPEKPSAAADPPKQPPDLKSPSNLLFVLGSLVAVFFGVFVFFKFFKAYRVQSF